MSHISDRFCCPPRVPPPASRIRGAGSLAATQNADDMNLSLMGQEVQLFSFEYLTDDDELSLFEIEDSTKKLKN